LSLSSFFFFTLLLFFSGSCLPRPSGQIPSFSLPPPCFFLPPSCYFFFGILMIKIQKTVLPSAPPSELIDTYPLHNGITLVPSPFWIPPLFPFFYPQTSQEISHSVGQHSSSYLYAPLWFLGVVSINFPLPPHPFFPPTLSAGPRLGLPPHPPPPTPTPQGAKTTPFPIPCNSSSFP